MSDRMTKSKVDIFMVKQDSSMATIPYNITIKQKDGSDWKVLYPKTLIGQVEGLQDALDAKEDVSNKVTVVSSESTDVQYPSANAVYLLTRTYVHTQSVTSDTWSITHNLDKFPSVTVIDSANSVVHGDVKYISKNEVELKFSGGFQGKAYLN